MSHHSPKAFEGVSDITTQNAVRGTGEFGAMASIIFGVLKLDNATTKLHIACTDARDDEEELEPFEVEGRPYIDDTGDFKLVSQPGKADPLPAKKSRTGKKSGPQPDPSRPLYIEYLMKMEKERAEDALAKPWSAKELAAMLNVEFHLPVEKHLTDAAVRKLIFEGRAAQKKKEEEDAKQMEPLFKKEALS